MMASQEPSKAPTPSPSQAAPAETEGDASSPNEPLPDDAPPDKLESEIPPPPPRPPSPLKKCYDKVRPTLVKLLLVLLKGLLLRKHQWFITFLEFTAPIAVVLTLSADPGGEKFVPAEPFHTTSMENMRDSASSKSGTIVYFPKNPETERIMNSLLFTVCRGGPCGFTLIPEDDEVTIEKKVKGPRRVQYPDFIAAIVFPDELKELSNPGSTNGIITYKIRMSEWKTPVTKRLHRANLGPHLKPDPFELYATSGFLAIQYVLDKVLVERLTNGKEFNREVSLRPMSYPDYPYNATKGVIMEGTLFAGPTIGLLHIFFLVTIVRNFVHEKRTGVTELLKLNGLAPWMQWLGYFLNSFVPSLFIISIITVVLYTGVGEGPLLVASDPFLVWTILLLYVVSSIFFCFFICSIFENANMAVSLGVMFWFVTAVLHLIPLHNEEKLYLTIFPNCALSYAFALFAKMETVVDSDTVDKDNDRGLAAGAQWSNLDKIYVRDEDLPNVATQILAELFDQYRLEYTMTGISLQYVMIVWLGSSLVYLLLAIYLDAVLPRTHGVSRPWYFFTFRCGRKKIQSQQNQTILPPAPEMLPEVEQQQTTTGDGEGAPPLEGTDSSSIKSNENNQATMTEANVNREELVPEIDPFMAQFLQNFESEPQNATVGIELINLVKKYHYSNGFCRWRTKAAVNGVNLRMYAGDIFALLGHNGAGKTTIISMITGFFAPTSGSVLVQGYDLKYDLDKARRYIGYCPQQDLFFERLSVWEQLLFFGMLRGQRWGEASREADMWLMKMGLTMGKNKLGKTLSGGQKRKLCLGMALMGGTKVLVLDEPTTGLDPQSRRSIWDILLGLRGDRTILITTHFMEEADVLGDRIAIVCDGQIYCCGSVSFLKKRFGYGATLKLTVSMPEPPPPIIEDGAPPPVPEESAAPVPEGSVPPVPEEAAPPPEMSQPPVPELDPLVTENLVEFAQKHINNAYPKLDVRRRKVNEVFLTLPADTTNTSTICSLMADLTKNKEKLDIQKVSLQQTTMDEVFLTVGKLAEQKTGVMEYQWSAADFAPARKQKGAARFLTQFLALCFKRIVYLLRKPITFIIEFILYLGLTLIIFWVIILLFSALTASVSHMRSSASSRSGVELRTSSSSDNIKTHPLLMSLDSYESPITFCSYSGDNADIAKNVQSVIKSQSKNAEIKMKPGNSEDKTLDEIKEIGKEDFKKYKYRHIFSAVVNQGEFLGLFNPVADHAAPVALNVITNALLRALTSAAQYTIKVINHPLRDPNGQKPETNDFSTGRHHARSASGRYHRGLTPNDLIGWNEHMIYAVGTIPGVLVMIGPLLFTSNFVRIPTEERLCSAKRLQIMTGVHPALYWLSTFFWDYILYGIFVCGVVGTVILLEDYYEYPTLIRGDGWLALFLILMTYGFQAIAYVYLITLSASSVVAGFASVVFTGVITGLLAPLILIVTLVYPSEILVLNQFVSLLLIKLPFWVFPTFPAVEALARYFVYALRYPLCLNQQTNAWTKGDCETGRFLQFYRKHLGINLFAKGGLDYTYSPGILVYICIMLFNGLVYLVILMLNEYLIIEKIRNRNARASPGLPFGTDDDVLEEAKRINELFTTGRVGEDSLIVQGLTKIFQKCCQRPDLAFTSVNQLSFGVHYGECFGLLGVNGAGKTTTFRMITGDVLPTNGNAYGFGKSLQDNRMKFFQHFGYCPQFDACLPMFTGQEMLEMFGMLRGMPRGVAKQEARKWLQRMDLQESGNHQCGRYSGGMKRRIGIGIAMIGDPELMLLDEPTSGVDPVNRMKFWQIVEIMRDMAGHSIILTSHSMDECEALCGRLGIMVNGQFQCFGEVGHLKEKFAQGYSLVLHLFKEMPSESTPPDDELMDKLAELHDKLTESFGEVVLKDKHRKVVQYYILNPSIPLDVMYQSMEKIYSDFKETIEEYVLSETSLEEVFLAFAKAQGAEFSDKTNLCQRVCKCCPCCK